MTKALKTFSILAFLSGTVWFFQGLGWLPGTFMYRNADWIIYGLITAALSGGVWYFLRRKEKNG